MHLRKANLPAIVAAILTIGCAAVSAQTVSVLHSFSGGDGVLPAAGLVQASDGNFYGMTAYGGTGGSGTVFRITPSGTLTVLHSFSGSPSDGAVPVAGLVQGSGGNFYGTTALGGANALGTVFRITSTGTLTVLHSFSGSPSEGSGPFAGLVQGSDGNFYGTTALGGANQKGTIFKIDPMGTLTTLHSFSGSLGDGAFPTAGLVPGIGGTFYGTTTMGGLAGLGTVYVLAPGGIVVPIHSFLGIDGAFPWAGLVHGSNGNFYGTTTFGGANGLGTAVRMTPLGAVTVLHSFSGSDGSFPFAALVQGSDGNFYGTTFVGGTQYDGTLFKTDSTGSFTLLHSFSGPVGAGAFPVAGLVQGSDGDFYGTTFGGGTTGQGAVFKLSASFVKSPL